MGVLDDAIREHLELKRRHGAGEEELRRQEAEALGPTRREVVPAAADEAEHAAVEAEAAEPLPDESEALAERPASLEDPATTLHEDEELALDERGLEPEPEPEADAEPEPAEPQPHAPGDTPARGLEALDEDELLAEDEAGESDDMLEDTPDFLQETPEHDRLWFEQKPPRDFDFD